MKLKKKLTGSPSAWKYLHHYPPGVIRIYARRKVSGKHVEAVSLQEIAIASGIPYSRVKEISECVNWDTVTVFEAERFCIACHFDPLNPGDRNRQNAYERNCKQLTFARNAPWWESESKPMIKKLREAAEQRAAS